MKLRAACVAGGFLSLVLGMSAQISGSNPAFAQVPPPLIQFSSTATDEGGNSLSGVVNISFSLYSSQQGGEPLWTEAQNNVQLDSTGHYSVQLGITKPNGVPTTLFTSGEARWLGVQIAGQAEQPRVLLLSVPYALKAGDAATVGGLPPSAFVLAAGPNGIALASTAESLTAQSVSPDTATDVTTTGGTVGYLPVYNGTSTIIDSVLFQSATSPFKIGVNTATPATTLDVKGAGTIRGPLSVLGTVSLPATGTATATAGKNSQSLNLSASAFNGSVAVNQTFRWQAEPAENDSAVPSGTLNLLFAKGTAAPTETGLHIASNGQITFATGQPFPGTGDGTITGVTAGTDLTGGGTTGSVTLNVDTTKVPQLGAPNAFTQTQYITATNPLGAILQVTSGSQAIMATGATAGVVATGSTVGVLATASAGIGVEGIGGTGVVGVSTGPASTSTTAFNPGGSFTGYSVPSDADLPGTDGVDSTGGNGGSGVTSYNGGGNGITAVGGPGGLAGDGAGGYFTGGNHGGGGDGVNAIAGSGNAGEFTGDLSVSGAIFAGTKDFKIDHPLDPANKYLVHASVESSEMMNIYTGNITTDGQGQATVQLPEWFEVLNTDFRYQLTVIGQFAQAIVAREIENNQFEIRTNAPNVKVSWQVTGVRQDAYAKANPLVVEQEKDRLRGFYIHPELYGAPLEKQIEWARHPQMMRRIQEMQARQQATIRAAAQPVAAQSK